MSKPAIVAACVCLFATASQAEEPAAPKPSPLIARLAGAWKGTGTYTEAGKNSPVSWKMTCTTTAQGFASECRLQMSGIPGMPSYEGSSVFGVDPSSGTVHWYWVTNTGEVHDHAGPTPTGEAFDLPYKEANKVVESLTMTVEGKTMKFRSATMGSKGEEAAMIACEGKK